MQNNSGNRAHRARTLLAGGLCLLAVACGAKAPGPGTEDATHTAAPAATIGETSMFDFTVQRLDGSSESLADHRIKAC